ncbi:MAG: DUF4013 domain-containing protein [Verrucomicrobiae bacterium]|nr:DUF4013 domain-containing protein [Verrucomicrobiae bacterium]
MPPIATTTDPTVASESTSVVEPPEGKTRREPFPRGCWNKLKSALDWVFGLGAIVVGLAVLSVVPVLNLFSLGYLLEASGRVARTGRFRDGFVGVRKASVLGSVVIGGWLVLLPAQIAASYWNDAELISAGSQVAKGWRVALIVLTVAGLAQIAWACVRGGRLRHFLWPAPVRAFRALRHPRLSALHEMGDRVGDWVAGLRLPHYFWLGFRGFVSAVMWLAIPVGILMAASQIRNDGLAALTSLLGAGLLMIAVLYLPFLQAHFARTERFEVMFRIKEVRQFFSRAPIAFWFALFITVLFALPLYLLKIELTPREVAWLPALLFVVFIFPARLLVGWALNRGTRRELPRHWVFRWFSRLAAIPVVVAYAFFVWATQYLSWHGSFSLLEQHAFLVPAPLLGL